MKYNLGLLLAPVAFFAISFGNAQSRIVVLEKNQNVRAKNLIHELNETSDSLILRGQDIIRYVYSINQQYQREIDAYAGSREYKIGLDTLTEGKHVMVVSHQSKLVVFVLKVFKDEEDLIAAQTLAPIIDISDN